MAGFGALRQVPRAPANVGLAGELQTLSLGGANRCIYAGADLRATCWTQTGRHISITDLYISKFFDYP